MHFRTHSATIGKVLVVAMMSFHLLDPSYGAVLTLAPKADARIVDIVGADGTSSYLSVYNRSTNVQRTVISFDLSMLNTNVVISNATLRLFADANLWPTGNPNGQNMEVYRVTRPWLETQTTWSHATTGSLWSSPGGDYAGATGLADQYAYATNATVIPDNYTNISPVELDWNITPLVHEWQSGLHSNYGLLLLSYSGNGLIFHSRESGNHIPQLLIGFTNFVPPGTLRPSIYPIKVNPSNSRVLADQSDYPFMIVGDSPHSLLVNVSESDAALYVADRGTNGFNSLWAELLCNGYTGGRPDGSMLDGTIPFTNTLPGGSYDLTTPNEPYFAHVDRLLSLAAANGIQVMLDPIDTGGWIQTALDNGVTRCRAYGQYLGKRYQGFPNLIWLNGNDFQTWQTPDDDAVITAVALGIKDWDTNHIQTVQLNYFFSGSLDDPNWASIISLDAAYTYYPTYAQVLAEYSRPNPLPVFMVEAHYEFEDLDGELGTSAVLRRQEYWTMLSGATGQLYGNHYTWPFLQTWQSHLDSVGVTELQHVSGLLQSRAWFNLAPDTNHVVLISGFGTYETEGMISGNDYATAVRSSNGQTVMAYLPTQRTFSVDMSKISGMNANAWWFNPQTGIATNFAQLATSGIQNFTPPDSNDWVLVLDDASYGLGAPGSIRVSTSWLPLANVGIPYSFLLQGSGGAPPYHWSLLPGSDPLPQGLSFSTNGLLAGTPGKSGKSDLIIQITDSKNASVIQLLSFSTYSSTPSTLTLTAPPGQTPSQIAQNGFQLFLGADAPGTLTVEYTTNFFAWVPFMTLQYTGGQAVILDPGGTSSPPRFYRARSP